MTALGLPTRVENLLVEAGVGTVRELLSMTRKELEGIGGFGEKAFNELQEKLQNFSLVLKDAMPLMEDMAADAKPDEEGAAAKTAEAKDEAKESEGSDEKKEDKASDETSDEAKDTGKSVEKEVADSDEEVESKKADA